MCFGDMHVPILGVHYGKSAHAADGWRSDSRNIWHGGTRIKGAAYVHGSD
jgi:hypothetical protein